MDMILLAVDQIYDEIELYFYVFNVCLRVHWALLETCPLLYRELGASSYQLKLLESITVALLLWATVDHI